MAKQTREQLGVKPNDEIYIKGEVSFARIDKLVEGDALDKVNEERKKRGMIQANAPFRSLTLVNPVVVGNDGSPLAKYHGQEVYTQKASGNKAITLETKSPYAPAYGHIRDGKIVEIEDPKANPAPGQIVYVRIRAYDPKNSYSNLSSAFDAIVFDEGDINFYSGGSLTGFGKVLDMPVESNGAPTVKDVEGKEPKEAPFATTSEPEAPASTEQADTSVEANPFS